MEDQVSNTIPTVSQTIENPPNDTPQSINTNELIATNPNYNFTSSISQTDNVSVSNTTNSESNSYNHHGFKQPSDLISVHHNNTVSYVLNAYCLPISDTFNSSLDTCKYNRNCVVSRSKIITNGKLLRSMSPTTFSSDDCTLNKYKYEYMDTRLIRCFNCLSKNKEKDTSKQFHYVCYKHMMATQNKKEMTNLVIRSSDDKLFSMIHKSVDKDVVRDKLLKDSTEIVVPICGKRCYNSLINNSKKIDTKEESEYALTQSWEKDGGNNKRTSIQVLIDWLTTEENCSSYFGGLDTEGRTSSTRKEAYHHRIRDMIEKENGKFYIMYNFVYYIIIFNTIFTYQTINTNY